MEGFENYLRTICDSDRERQRDTQEAGGRVGNVDLGEWDLEMRWAHALADFLL